MAPPLPTALRRSTRRRSAARAALAGNAGEVVGLGLDGAAAGPLHNLDRGRRGRRCRAFRRGGAARCGRPAQCRTPIVVVSSKIRRSRRRARRVSASTRRLRHHPALLAERRRLDDIENAGVRAQMVDRVSEILAGLIVDLAFENDDALGWAGCASIVSNASTRRQLLSPGMRRAPKP